MSLRRGMMASAGSGADPYYSSVTSLLLFGGADGSTTFTDEKGITWTANGNAQIDTSLGYNVGLFDGAGDYLSAASSAAFGFGDADYTVDALVVVDNVDAYQALFDNRGGGEGIGLYAFGQNVGAGEDYAKMLLANNSAIIARASSNTPVDTLVHVALARSSGVVKGFLAGVEKFSVTDSRTLASSTPAVIGANYLGSAGFFSGKIKAHRVTNGVCRWTSGFTPPTSFPNS